MITKIQSLVNIGKFVDWEQTGDFCFKSKQKSTNCNIIFGFNGSGKSTISNVLSLFSLESFSNNKEHIRNSIKRNSSEDIVVKFVWQGNNKPIERIPDTYQICVFNSNFIEDYVTNGVRKFQNSVGSLTTPELIEINDKIQELQNNKSILTNRKTQLESDFKRIKDRISKEFNDKFPGNRLTGLDLDKLVIPNKNFNALEVDKKSLETEFKNCCNAEEILSHISTLDDLQFEQINLELPKINKLLNQSIKQLSKDALQQRIENVKNVFYDEPQKQAAEKWFRYGKSILEHQNTSFCPLCNSNISETLNSILTDFNAYFDKEYDQFINELENKIKEFETIIDKIQNKIIPSVTLLDSIHSSYKTTWPDIKSDKFDIQDCVQILLNIKSILTNKLANIEKTDQISDCQVDAVCKLNSFLQQSETIRTTLKTNLQQLAPRNKDKIIADIKQNYKDLAFLEFDNLDIKGGISNYTKIQNDLSIIQTDNQCNSNGLLYWENRKNKALADLKTESKEINVILSRMGIDSFTVDLRDKTGDEKKDIIVKYTNSTSEKSDRCLSDGEKTALAFAYFICKYNAEITDKNNVIVVIDDPISSLDENRLYSTAHLINDSFNDIHQLFVLSHNFLFLKFFNSVYATGSKHFFLHNNMLDDLPEEMNNFETTYFYMLKEIKEFCDGNTDYINVRKYLPNFIRRVLETFFAFKFALLKDHKRKSPGLDAFKPLVSKYDKDLENRLNKIIDITNKQSHGSVQTLTESTLYISEDDLRNISESAIYIMNTMDSIHMTSTDSLSTKSTQKLSPEEQQKVDSGEYYIPNSSNSSSFMSKHEVNLDK